MKHWIFRANRRPLLCRKTGTATQCWWRWAYLEQETLGSHKLVGTHKWQFRKIAVSWVQPVRSVRNSWSWGTAQTHMVLWPLPPRSLPGFHDDDPRQTPPALARGPGEESFWNRPRDFSTRMGPSPRGGTPPDSLRRGEFPSLVWVMNFQKNLIWGTASVVWSWGWGFCQPRPLQIWVIGVGTGIR